MQGPEPPTPPERSAATGAWQSPLAGVGGSPAPGLDGNDPPTVRSGNGSSVRRIWMPSGAAAVAYDTWHTLPSVDA